ncbi:hypothetical protein IV511_18815 [Enterobacter quasihormaechei]|uniref:hypothetical protein n=1 Tax=Enterobacter quasihormaechei TaxID=2529382 RepID=UPI002F416D3A
MRIKNIIKRCPGLGIPGIPVVMLAQSAGITISQESGTSVIPVTAPVIRPRTFGDIADCPGFSDLKNWVISLILVSMLLTWLFLQFLEEIASDALRKNGQK